MVLLGLQVVQPSSESSDNSWAVLCGTPRVILPDSRYCRMPDLYAHLMSYPTAEKPSEIQSIDQSTVHDEIHAIRSLLEMPTGLPC